MGTPQLALLFNKLTYATKMNVRRSRASVDEVVGVNGIPFEIVINFSKKISLPNRKLDYKELKCISSLFKSFMFYPGLTRVPTEI